MPDTMTPPLEGQDRFQFDCSPQVTCFNACCRDLNQFLYPYDIIRIKKALQISSGEFLREYTTRHVGPETGLPIVSLKPKSNQSLACPFVTPQGCGVYPGRPASCRLYPLARAISRQPETGVIHEHFALIKENHCCGFQKGTDRTAHQWMEEQGVIEYNCHNDRMITILGLKRQHHPQPLDLAQTHLFYRTLYDLDHFRASLDQQGVFQKLRTTENLCNAALKDDAELLTMAERWVILNLFGKDALGELDDRVA